MQIAYTMAPGRGDTDLLLQRVAQDFMNKGHRVCGTAQINTECETGGPCDMDVQILPDGKVLRISQSLGAGARGCRLDPAALETAVGLVGAELEKGADLLIINKFGKHEADGRGFRPIIADAIANDIPVLVGTNRLNADAFHEFTGGAAVRLDPSLDTINDWIAAAMTATLDVA